MTDDAAGRHPARRDRPRPRRVAIEPDTKDWTWVLDRPLPECGFVAGDVDVRDLPATVRALTPRWLERRSRGRTRGRAAPARGVVGAGVRRARAGRQPGLRGARAAHAQTPTTRCSRTGTRTPRRSRAATPSRTRRWSADELAEAAETFAAEFAGVPRRGAPTARDGGRTARSSRSGRSGGTTCTTSSTTCTTSAPDARGREAGRGDGHPSRPVGTGVHKFCPQTCAPRRGVVHILWKNLCANRGTEVVLPSPCAAGHTCTRRLSPDPRPAEIRVQPRSRAARGKRAPSSGAAGASWGSGPGCARPPALRAAVPASRCACLTRYICRSAARTASSGSVPRGARAVPMLTPTWTGPCGRSTGRRARPRRARPGRREPRGVAAGAQDDELVPAEPGDDVVHAGDPAQAGRDLDQDEVADVVAVVGRSRP